MGRTTLIAAACLLSATQAPSQAAHRSFFEERLLDRSPVIVRARYDADQSCFDVDVAAFKVLGRLKGSSDDRILVLGAMQLSQRLRGTDRLLFLKPEPSGCLYRIVDVIDLVEDADAVEALVRGFIALSAEIEPTRHRAGLKQLVQDGLSLKADFPRRLAARELDRIARRDPPVLTLDELAAFEHQLPAVPADESALVEAAFGVAEDAMLRSFAGTQAGFPRGPARTQYLRSVGQYLKEGEDVRRGAAADQIAFRFGERAAPFLMKLLDDPAMQERALMHLGGMQWRDAVPVVLGRLKAPGAGAGAMIACLGEIGDESAVPAITPFLGSADHFDAAAIALARINTSASNRALDAMLRELRRDARQQSRVEMLQRLRSPGFVEEDGARRLEARGRYPRA